MLVGTDEQRASVLETADLRPVCVCVGEVLAGQVVRTFEVSGMCCDGCPGKLYSALQAVPGVVKAAVSFEEGTASALVSTDVDSAQLEVALTFDKYSATLRDG